LSNESAKVTKITEKDVKKTVCTKILLLDLELSGQGQKQISNKSVAGKKEVKARVINEPDYNHYLSVLFSC